MTARNRAFGLMGKLVQFRFAFASDSSYNYNGIAIDDFQLIVPDLTVIPQCPKLLYPEPNSVIYLPLEGNFRWISNDSVPGYPTGYNVTFGTTNPPSDFSFSITGSTLALMNLNLSAPATYYWKIVPLGYTTANVNCAVRFD